MVPLPDSPSTSHGPGIGPPGLSPDWPELENDSGLCSPRELGPGTSECAYGPGALPSLLSASPSIPSPRAVAVAVAVAAKWNRETVACAVREAAGAACAGSEPCRPSVHPAPLSRVPVRCHRRSWAPGISSSSTSQSLSQTGNRHVCAAHRGREQLDWALCSAQTLPGGPMAEGSVFWTLASGRSPPVGKICSGAWSSGSSGLPLGSSKARSTGPHPRELWFSSLGWGLRICIPGEFPGAAGAAAPGPYFENRCPWEGRAPPPRCPMRSDVW